MTSSATEDAFEPNRHYPDSTGHDGFAEPPEEPTAGPSDWYRRSPSQPTSPSGWSGMPTTEEDWGKSRPLDTLGYREDPAEEEFGSLGAKDASARVPVPPALSKRFSTVHPSVSRLRSHMRSVSTSTIQSDVSSPPRRQTPSLFSRISAPSEADAEQRQAFAFHPLRSISSSLANAHRATVLDVRGMIALGTAAGAILVFSFGQDLKHTLGPMDGDGAVTAIKISPDQTYIAAGYASGNIRLWELSRPATPARTTLALTTAQVQGGRREGHIQGSRIVHIGFVGARHTAIITGDEAGRAFWWSLGKVLGVESNDVIRILGNYHIDTAKKTTLFAAAPLPLGDKKSLADDLGLCALLTPAKLVIVGMKPVPKTIYRRYRPVTGNDDKIIGCAVWLPAGTGAEQHPMLVYSWGDTIRFLRVTPAQSDPKAPVSLDVAEISAWKCPNAVAAVEVYDANHLLVFTADEGVLLDRRSMRAVETTSLQSRLLVSHDFHRNAPHADPTFRYSISCHREKIFLLTLANVQVGSLQHWNDRILARVHQGDFLAAIQVALSYYDGTAEANTIGLPDDLPARRQLVGDRMKGLIQASLDWAFSEERMQDDTHYSADGRGVDLTGLFEGLAAACIDACVSMSDLDYLFDECYERFQQTGIGSIFLRQVEPRVLDGLTPPPRVIKDLMMMHEHAGEYQEAEAIIWSVEPHTLDLDQAIRLCEEHVLWDSLIYVYTRALRDYIAPLAKLLPAAQQDIQAVVRIFKYLEATLAGEQYPDRQRYSPNQAAAAKQAVYDFIFSPGLIDWPSGRDGRPIPGDQENYPYLHRLARLDLEALLHALDIAFEDSHLNDSQGAISRQYITNLLLELVNSEAFTGADATLIRIFVARNLPKYPQFLHMPPSVLHEVLVGLASDEAPETCEDRQLATEYLLSAYTPQDEDHALSLFEKAGFWRILQDIYRREGRWGSLLRTLIVDSSASEDSFDSIRDLVHYNPVTTRKPLRAHLSTLLRLSIRRTALLLDEELPDLHRRAIDSLTNDHDKMDYFTALFTGRQASLDTALAHQYVEFLRQNDAASVIPFLQDHPTAVDLSRLEDDARRSRAAEIQIWALDQRGAVQEAFQVVAEAMRENGINHDLDRVTSIARLAIEICRRRTPSDIAESSWFTVLHELVDLLHIQDPADAAVQPLRLLIKETLNSLMSTQGIVFTRLFKRLIDATASAPTAIKGRAYSEFRMFVTEMLHSYRSEGNLLEVTQRLVQADLLEALQVLTARRQRGIRTA